MDALLLEQLNQITPEEQALLSGKSGIDRSVYMKGDSAQVDQALLLEKGKLITIRPHTRFVHFPKHTHNYVEMIYMCQGQTRHLINGIEVTLNAGELLVMSQNATQEVLPAGEEDIAVNFIILPQFFDTAIQMIDENENPIRDFLIGCIQGKENHMGFLHFEATNILPIQNLVENLIWTLANQQPNKRSINQLTMGLLFLQLTNHTETLRTAPSFAQQELMLHVLRYIEEHYRDGQLQAVAQQLHYAQCWLSREIKRRSGKTFTQLVQDKRMSQAAFLLKTTAMTVLEISESVGYENVSYFHRVFQERYGVSPRKYRICK